jgi:prevent-host-death family protein
MLKPKIEGIDPTDCSASIRSYHEVHDPTAKANLSRLLEEAASGKEVIIVRGNEPMAKLVPIRKARKKRQAGSMTGKITCSADAFAPLTNKELSDLGFE